MKFIQFLAFWLGVCTCSFGQNAIQHEIGIDWGGGISGVLDANRAQASLGERRIMGLLGFDMGAKLGTAFSCLNDGVCNLRCFGPWN